MHDGFYCGSQTGGVSVLNADFAKACRFVGMDVDVGLFLTVLFSCIDCEFAVGP